MASSSSSSKPSIYPTATPEILLVETTSPLEGYIGTAHQAVDSTINDVTAKVHGVVSRWIDIEHRVEARMKNIIPSTAEEALTPGFIRVGIATLTSSILVRTRGGFVRGILPTIVFLGSMRYCLPVTSSNIGKYVRDLEYAYIPTVAAHHSAIEKRVCLMYTSTRDTLRGSKGSILDNASYQMDRGLGKVASEIEKQTGWKVGDIFRGGK